MESNDIQEINASTYEPEMFPFTNPLEKDVTLVWGKKAYTFAARSTTNLLGLIPDASPIEVQGIRKEFAIRLSQQRFFESQEYKAMEAQAPAGSNLTPPLVPMDKRVQFMEECLIPLKKARATTKDVPQDDIESKLHVDPDTGKRVSKPVAKGEDLIGAAKRGEF